VSFLRRFLKSQLPAAAGHDSAWRPQETRREHDLHRLGDAEERLDAADEPIASAAPGAGPVVTNGTLLRYERADSLPARPGATSFAREIWAVGGGKGGIGKSLITSNLGISLARAGRRVVLVDADLGGANLHTCLGIPEPKLTLTDFVSRRVKDIEEILIKTGVPNLSLISGAHDFLSAANLNFVQKTMLLRRIAELDADLVLLDLGAGTAYNTLDFFLLAQKGIVVAVPEPTSIENCYRFIKSAFYRRLRRVVANAQVKRLIESAMDQKNALGIRTPNDLLERIAQMDPLVGEVIQREVGNFRPKIIVNQARTRADVEIGEHMRSACKKYFGIQVEYLGAIDYDDAVWQSVRRREPLLVKHPGSVSARSVERIATRLLQGA
jgi:flagellar biosynthesis protein FlhG